MRRAEVVRTLEAAGLFVEAPRSAPRMVQGVAGGRRVYARRAGRRGAWLLSRAPRERRRVVARSPEEVRAFCAGLVHQGSH